MATYERLDYGSPDGSKWGGSATDKLGFFDGTPQAQYAATAVQATTRAGTIRLFVVPASTGAHSYSSSAEETMTASSLASDSCVVIARSSTTPGIAIAGYRVSAADTFGVTMMNVSTGATIVPVSTQAYQMIEFKANGGMVTTVSWSPTAVAASTTAEQSVTVPGAMPGQMVVVNKPTQQTALGIANARVTAASTVAVAFANISSAAITPTASETYTFALVPTMHAVSPVVHYGVPATTVSAAIPVSSTVEQTTTLMNLNATDIFLAVSAPAYQVGRLFGDGNINSSGVLSISQGSFSSAAVTPTSSAAFNVAIYRPENRAPIQVYTTTFAGTTVPASTTVEYTSACTGLITSSIVFVNKLFHTANIGVANARVSAADTITVALFNTASTATVVPAGNYRVGATQRAPAWGIGASAYQSSAAIASTCATVTYMVRPAMDATVADLRAALAANGFLPS